MPLAMVSAKATTCRLSPGAESTDDSGSMRIRDRVFEDVVDSDDRRLCGRNRLSLDIDVDTATGKGRLTGRFVLTLDLDDGAWQGGLSGDLAGDAIRAEGLARGSGSLEGAVLRVDFERVFDREGPHPCDAPIAFFDMRGMILEPD